VEEIKLDVFDTKEANSAELDATVNIVIFKFPTLAPRTLNESGGKGGIRPNTAISTEYHTYAHHLWITQKSPHFINAVQTNANKNPRNTDTTRTLTDSKNVIEEV